MGHRHRRASPWLLTAAKGDLPAARSALEQALVEHRRVPQPFELARTLLVKGEVERRAKQKRAARSSLEQALGLFQSLGAPLWAQRARDDLARVGGAAPPTSELTPTEERIARLVGEGKKNREVAEALFISVKTVEANLSRIFHKLGVRSRTELTRRIAATEAGRVSPRFLSAAQTLTCCRRSGPIAQSEGGQHGAGDGQRTPFRAGLAAHRHRGGHGLRPGGRRDRRSRAHGGWVCMDHRP